MQTYFNTSKQSIGIFKCVARFMAQYTMNPTPINYAVAYEYCMCKEFETPVINVNFMKELEKTLEQYGVLDDISGLNLYRKYIKDVPENPHEVIDKTSNLPKILNGFIEKASSYVERHARIIAQNDATTMQSSLAELKTLVMALHDDVKSAKGIHRRVASLVDEGGSGSLKDVFTGLPSDREATYVIEQMRKNSSADIYILMIGLEGVSELKKKFGEQIEEALARQFVRTMTPLLPEGLTLYRWIADDAYLFISHDKDQLERAEGFAREYLRTRELTHKFTREKLNEILSLKTAVIAVPKSLTVAAKSAKQQLRG